MLTATAALPRNATATDAAIIAALSAGQTQREIARTLHAGRDRIRALRDQMDSCPVEQADLFQGEADAITVAFLEGMLTGEEVPVATAPVPDAQAQLDEIVLKAEKPRIRVKAASTRQLHAATALTRPAREIEIQIPAGAAPTDMVDVRIADLERQLAALRSLVASEPVPAQTETPKPRITVPASPLQQDVRPPRRQYRPLGEDGPYVGEIFGVHGKQAPLILEGPSSRLIRVLYIPDTHWHPALLALTLRICRLIGYQVGAGDYDYVVHGGDGSDWSSCSLHSGEDTYEASIKPTIAQDIECHGMNLGVLTTSIRDNGFNGRLVWTKGNHCEWPERYESKFKSWRGLATGRRDAQLDENGWLHRRYGETVYIGGTGVVHALLNKMGRPGGGENASKNLAKKLVHDLVWFHTHAYEMGMDLKHCLEHPVRVINAGACMPIGFVGDYAHRSLGTAVTSGLLEAQIQHGRIVTHRRIDMSELEARFGSKVDRTFSGYGAR